MQGLRALGDVEGESLIVEHRWPKERSEQFGDIIAELGDESISLIAGAATQQRAGVGGRP